MSSSFDNIKKLLEDPTGFSLNRLMAESETIKLKDPKPVIDVSLRERMLSLLASQSLEEVKSLLKIAVAAALANVCSAPTPFLLFADVFNTKPISVCEELFAFMEETITTLKDVPLFGSGRNTLLRMCNDLLRRLSKSQNTVFCGQIQLFLSRLFPLDEKSGLNLMSNFNLDKETAYNHNPDTSVFRLPSSGDTHNDELEEGEATDNSGPLEVDAKLYLKFWSLQEFFRLPTSCFQKSNWQSFVRSTETIVEVFASIKLQTTDDALLDIKTCGTKFSRYLTSEKLLDLQLMDTSFRRNILVQLLLIFQYLTTPSKFKTAEQVLSDEQLEWVNRKRELVLRLLQNKNEEKAETSFVSTVERIMEREAFWNRWKNEGCPSFIRQTEASLTNMRKRRVNALVDRSGNKIYRFGNRNLDKLWSNCPDNFAACRDMQRIFRPNLQTYFQDTITELDPAEKVEEEYRSINREEWCWRSLRCLSRYSPHFYINWNPPGRPVKDYLVEILTKKLIPEDDKKPQLSIDPSTPTTSTCESDGPSPAKQARVTDPNENVTSRRIKSTTTGTGDRVRTPKKSSATNRSAQSSHSSRTTADAFDPEVPVLDQDDLDNRPIDVDNDI